MSNQLDLLFDDFSNVTHIISFSGGRTSAFMLFLMLQAARRFGWKLLVIYCDTGAETPATLKFIRDCVKAWEFELIVLRAVIRPLGVGNGYQVFEAKDLMNSAVMPPMEPFKSMLEVYSTPYIGGAFCTARLKTEPFDAYVKDHVKGPFITYLGMRTDEPKRLTPKPGILYLADLVKSVTKADINRFWSQQFFDLQLTEESGNCTMCIKKSISKLKLSCLKNPGLARMWKFMLNNKKIRVNDERSTPPKVMYRGYLSLDAILEMSKDYTIAELEERLKYEKRYQSGSCTSSCEGIPSGFSMSLSENGRANLTALISKVSERIESKHAVMTN